MALNKIAWMTWILLALVVLACSFWQMGSEGGSELDLAETQVSLQTTQTAFAQEQSAKPVMPLDAAPAFTYDGVSFTPGIGQSVSAQDVPAEVGNEPFWNMPEHIRLEITGYPVANDYHKPVIYIFSIDTLRAAGEFTGEVVDDLLALLASRPAVPYGTLPFLPIFNAGQLGQIQVKFLDFETGSGVRFLTQLGQDFWPFHNKGLIYTYQGLTADRRFYVAALMPISHPVLNEYDDFQPPEDFYLQAEEFLRSQVALLNAQPEGSYYPSIDTLDALVRSLRIEKKNPGV